jgi:hypothetical protein
VEIVWVLEMPAETGKTTTNCSHASRPSFEQRFPEYEAAEMLSTIPEPYSVQICNVFSVPGQTL